MSTEKDLTIKTWNEAEYMEFLKYLMSLQDAKYKEFHSSLVLNTKYKMIGIRVPIMRDIAKKIAKSNIADFLQYAQSKYYEEVMIQGLVISHLKDEKLFYEYFKEAIKMALNKAEFTSRVGIVIILNHFISKDNLNDIFNALNKIQSDKFYINMAEAWLLCEMYIKYPKETKEFLKNNSLNKFTQNKAISKIHDSYRVSKEEKEFLNKFRR